eukprot:s120_g38.t1
MILDVWGPLASCTGSSTGGSGSLFGGDVGNQFETQQVATSSSLSFQASTWSRGQQARKGQTAWKQSIAWHHRAHFETAKSSPCPAWSTSTSTSRISIVPASPAA